MTLPMQITFRGIPESPAAKQLIIEEAEHLDRYFPRIMSCQVMIESPHPRHHQGNLFHVRIDLTIPGKELVVRRDPAQHASHTDAYLAIRDAFREARRQLVDYTRYRRDRSKNWGRGRAQPWPNPVSKLESHAPEFV